MTVSSTTSRVSYTGNGAVVTFAYPFEIFFNTDLEVYLDGVLKTLTTDYTVSGVGDPNGGNVTFGVAPANGVNVLIVRVLPITQLSALPANDKFPSTVMETAIDKLTMLIQQLDEVDQRALKLALTSSYENLLLPDPSSGKFLRWNALLTGLENADMTLLGSLGLPVAVADGGTAGVTALAARQNLGLDGQVVRNLTNRTGGALVTGDVVALSTANDDSVVLGDTVGSKQVFVVALASISNLATGSFLVRGVADVLVQGALSRGQYVRKSATTLRVEDAGAAHGAAVEPPATALGVSIGAVSGSKARLVWWGVAFPAAAASTVPRGVIAGLTISNNGADATNDIDIAAGEAASDDAVAASRIWLTGTAMTKQLDIAWAAGSAAGGRITAEALVDGTWFVYVFRRTGGAIDYCFSQSLTPTLPDSGTNKRRIGAILRESGAIVGFTQNGDEFLRTTIAALDFNTTIGTTATDVTLAVPNLIKVNAIIAVHMSHGTIGTTLYVSSKDQADQASSGTAAPLGTIRNSAAAQFNTQRLDGIRTDAARAIRIVSSAATTTVRITTYGWWDSRGRNA